MKFWDTNREVVSNVPARSKVGSGAFRGKRKRDRYTGQVSFTASSPSLTLHSSAGASDDATESSRSSFLSLAAAAAGGASLQNCKNNVNRRSRGGFECLPDRPTATAPSVMRCQEVAHIWKFTTVANMSTPSTLALGPGRGAISFACN